MLTNFFFFFFGGACVCVCRIKQPGSFTIIHVCLFFFFLYFLNYIILSFKGDGDKKMWGVKTQQHYYRMFIITLVEKCMMIYIEISCHIIIYPFLFNV